MMSSLRRAAMLAAIALLSCAALALAAGPKKGATYSGTLSQGKQPITLKVAQSGKAVTANVQVAPFYCEGGSAGEREITKSSSIAKNGSFKATITYEFVPTHAKTTKLIVQGKFSGKSVKGTARSEFSLAKQCNGSTTFSAKTK